MTTLPNHSLNLFPYPILKHFELRNLSFKSKILASNPLKDSSLRNNPVLTPKGKSSNSFGLVLILSGFAGNGTKYLADKGFETTFLKELDSLFGKKRAPKAHYIFVDAWTFWGGSQFLNSNSNGNYEDYIVNELLPICINQFNVSPKKVAIMGQSSGGYGALHLSSKFPKKFPYCGAFAPDCFFEASLLPDLFKSAPFLNKNNNLKTLEKLHREQKILKQKNGFSILNSIAMAACYSPSENGKDVYWPINFSTGIIEQKIWNQWKQKDPVYFLQKRISKVRQLSGIFLDVGLKDEYFLNLGVQQIHQLLKSKSIEHTFSTFEGGHFESLNRIPLFWTWLLRHW